MVCPRVCNLCPAHLRQARARGPRGHYSEAGGEVKVEVEHLVRRPSPAGGSALRRRADADRHRATRPPRSESSPQQGTGAVSFAGLPGRGCASNRATSAVAGRQRTRGLWTPVISRQWRCRVSAGVASRRLPRIRGRLSLYPHSRRTSWRRACQRPLGSQSPIL